MSGGRSKKSGGYYDNPMMKGDRPSLGTGKAEQAASAAEVRKQRECAKFKAAGLKPPAHCK